MDGISKNHAAAASIKESISSLRKYGDQLQAHGHVNEAQDIHGALDRLQKSLKRIRVDEDGKLKAVH
ncbi:hypothetical protein [Pseudomonas akapageensis]|uniref:hypothetical protein n=1 Tax=Pseudomonas akapageensis TaxID=2609961 RepID=UPI001409EC8B|nr:hypothetical protein [Pseudomonas akapageensis]